MVESYKCVLRANPAGYQPEVEDEQILPWEITSLSSLNPSLSLELVLLGVLSYFCLWFSLPILDALALLL